MVNSPILFTRGQFNPKTCRNTRDCTDMNYWRRVDKLAKKIHANTHVTLDKCLYTDFSSFIMKNKKSLYKQKSVQSLLCPEDVQLVTGSKTCVQKPV